MENDDFIASLLLSRASVDFQEVPADRPQVESAPAEEPEQSKLHYLKLRQKAIFARASRSQKALLYTRTLERSA